MIVIILLRCPVRYSRGRPLTQNTYLHILLLIILFPVEDSRNLELSSRICMKGFREKKIHLFYVLKTRYEFTLIFKTFAHFEPQSNRLGSNLKYIQIITRPIIMDLP